LRFARYFNNSPTFWMNLQTRYDLEVAEDEIADKVERHVRPLEAGASGKEAEDDAVSAEKTVARQGRSNLPRRAGGG